MISLFENNKQMKNIDVLICSDGIEEENLIKLESIASKYDRKLTIISDENIKTLCKDAALPDFRGSYVVYAEAFPDKILPEYVDKVLILDAGDTIVTGSLKKLDSIDISNHAYAAVIDTPKHNPKFKHTKAYDCYDVELALKKAYYNCGMMFVNITKWKELHCTDLILNDLKREKHYEIASQTMINRSIDDKYVLKLPLEYNYMGFVFNRRDRDKIMTYGGFYTKEDAIAAKKNPIIIHWPGMTHHPYMKGALAAKKSLYWKYRKMTPWANTPINETAHRFYDSRISELKSIISFYCPYMKAFIKKYMFNRQDTQL